MKKKLFITLLVLLTGGFLFSSVSAAGETDKIKNRGTLKFGTSSEYIPFVFYDGDTLSGMDVALVQEIGKRLGVEVKVIDLAFDGLIDSVNIGQVDLIGGALSITDDRKTQVDFTRAYYKSSGVAIALTDYAYSGSGNDFVSSSLIGVQSGSDFDQWAKTQLVGSGQTSPQNIYTYSKIDDAIDALKDKDVDVVIMDSDVYDEDYKSTGLFKVIDDDVVEEDYAFAATPGSDLIPEINSIINAMMSDGTAQKIAEQFFTMNYGQDAQTTITRPAATQPVQVVPQTPTQPQQAGCINSMSYMADITIPDGTYENPGAAFTKTWRVYNNGSCTWDSTYSFVYVSGNYMNNSGIMIPKTVAPGQTVDLSVSMTAPNQYGSFKSYWQMRSPQGAGFGQTIWVSINIGGSAPQPASGNRPVITQFQPEYYANTGRCPRVHYNTTNATHLYFYINNAPIWDTTDAYGAKTLCINGGVGKYTISLVAVGPGGQSSDAFTYTRTSGGNPVPVVQQPTVVPVVQQPTPVPVISYPTPVPVISYPTPVPVVQQPSPVPVISYPTPTVPVIIPSDTGPAIGGGVVIGDTGPAIGEGAIPVIGQ